MIAVKQNERQLSAKAVSPGQRYSDTLTLKERAISSLIIHGIRHKAPLLSLHGGYAEICRSLNAVHRENPALFAVNFYKCTAKTGLLRLVYLSMEEAEIRRIEQALSDTWEQLQEKLLPSLTPRKKYLIIALEIAERVKYGNTEVYSNHTIAGLADGKAVCSGMSLLYIHFCQKAGLWVQYISGTLDGHPHAWTAVHLDGRKYYIDITVLQQCPLFYRVFPWRVFKTEKCLRKERYDFE